MELGGGYQDFIYSLGNCCGNIRTIFPCCCCVDYPYKQIDQSFVGKHAFTKESINVSDAMSRQWALAYNTSTHSLIGSI